MTAAFRNVEALSLALTTKRSMKRKQSKHFERRCSGNCSNMPNPKGGSYQILRKPFTKQHNQEKHIQKAAMLGIKELKLLGNIDCLVGLVLSVSLFGLCMPRKMFEQLSEIYVLKQRNC